MKKSCFALIMLTLAVASCVSQSRRQFSALDRAIEMQPYYDGLHRQRQDSLRILLSQAQTDTARWEIAYQLEQNYFYHNVDSCLRYARKMIGWSGNDRVRRSVSEACYANILYRMDSLQTALRVLGQIDTAALTQEGLGIYCFASYHVYGEMAKADSSYEQKCQEFAERWWKSDSTQVVCAFYHNKPLRMSGRFDEALANLQACPLRTINDSAKAHSCYAREYAERGDINRAIAHFTRSSEYDMRVSAKMYSSLYELARLLFRQGDIERANRYMQLTLEDAFESHYKMRYNDVIQSEMEIMDALLKQQEQKRNAYLLVVLLVTLLLGVALVSLVVLGRYSSRLNQSRSALSEVSSIKDGFLAGYMEKCVDYLNKVDEYRSSLRRTVRHEGPDAVMAMLRKPSFAAGEFNGLLTSFDATFLSIFPDFVDKVNEHMQPEYTLTMPEKGTLSTELRILALIKMGIVKRQKIAKILNMSVTTVYSYHSNLQKHSLHPDASFDQVIAGL